MINTDPIEATQTIKTIMSANLDIVDPNNKASLPNIYQAPLGFALASIKKDQVNLSLDTRIATASEEGLLLIGNEIGKPRLDGEELEVYRNRLIEFKRSYPNTFNDDRIIEKVEEIAGITQVKVLSATPNPGKITVYFLRGNDESPIPNQEQIDAVKTKILTIKPWEMSDKSVIVLAPNPIYITSQISNLLPNTDAMIEAVIVKISSFLKSLGIGKSLTISSLITAIYSTVDKYGNAIEDFSLILPNSNILASSSDVILPGPTVATFTQV